MTRSGAAGLLTLWLTLGLTRGAYATPPRAAMGAPEPAAADTEPARRSQLVLRIDGVLGAENERALQGLMDSELGRSDVSALIEHSTSSVAAWLRLVLGQRRALLIAILDVRAADAWRLSIVDAERGRAIVRSLPGGLSTNAASLEAVASILGSAAAALKEGLEVASQPVEDVVADAAAPKRTGPSKPPPRVEPRPEPHVERAATEAKAEQRALRIRGSAAGAIASLASAVPLTGGAAVSLGVQARSGVGLRAAAASYFPARFSTALGDFELARSLLSLTLGFSLRLRPLQIEPELGVTAELLRRSGASPSPGVFARDHNSYDRVGPCAAARLRYPLLSFMSLELVGSAAYYPRSIRFVARSPQTYDLGALSKFSLGAQLGVEIMPP